MALIGKIRKNSWILVVMIGIGLAGFIVMDMTSSSNLGGGVGNLTLGEVDGVKLDQQRFERAYSLVYSNSGGNVYNQRDQLWNYFLEEALVKEEADDLGLSVSNTELASLEFGPNYSPVILARFQNPQAPGQVDVNQLNQIKQLIDQGDLSVAINSGQLNPEFPAYWRYQREEIVKSRLQTKLNNMVSKAMYTPTWMAEMGFAEENHPVNFVYVKVPFDEIDNADVALTDADYSAFLNENESKYKIDEETRVVDYVVFNVAATATDSANLRKAVTELVPKFEASLNDSAFVLSNQGVIDPRYVDRQAVSPVVADEVFENMEVGEVYGPYLDGNTYKAVKLRDKVVMADSADSRHILISATTPATFDAAEKTIDSLMLVLESRTASFDSLALKFSQDPGSSSNGGKYENTTPNQFVPEYNQVLFMTGQVGRLYKVRTSYGWHLIEVLGRSSTSTERVKVAYVQKAIEPSKDTQNDVFQQASQFIGSNQSLDAVKDAATAAGLTVESSLPLKANDYLVGSLGATEDARQIVKWAYTANSGKVSPSVYSFQDPVGYYDNKYVVATLSGIQKAGLPQVETIKSEIEQLVMNQKKGEQLASAMNGKTLGALAAEYQTQVDTINGAKFSQSFLSGLGNEPKVVASAFNLDQGQSSAPIVGETGVYMIKTTLKPTLSAPNNLPAVRQTMSSQARAQVASRLVQGMVKNAEVDDFRARFY